MKDPFQRKSFWIILGGLFLVILLSPPFYDAFVVSGESKILSDIISWQSIHLRKLILMIIAFTLNYLGHLLFPK